MRVQAKQSALSSDSDLGLRSAPALKKEKGEAEEPMMDRELVEIWIPGRILHIYYHHGVSRVAEVPRGHPSLRSLALQGTMLSDHFARNVLSALKAVQLVHQAPDTPPVWTPFDARDTCQRCANAFSWRLLARLKFSPSQYSGISVTAAS